jgi:putative ribosome biogenesis GTPase RsgA
LQGKFKLVILGNTNVGKSTFLNHLLGFGNILNTNELRETNCIWKIKPTIGETFLFSVKLYTEGKIIENPPTVINNSSELK